MNHTEPKKASTFSVVAFGLAACVLYGVGAGLRGDIGILLNPLADQCGIAYQDVSLCIAVMQIIFGAAQPAFGVIASRRSNRFVLLLGISLLAAGMAGMSVSRSLPGLMLSLRLLFGAGAGALAFGLVLSSAIHFVGAERAMLVSGMLNAAAGLGSFAFAPVLQSMLQDGSAPVALTTLLIPVALLVPITLLVTSRDPAPTVEAEERRAGEAGLPFRGAFRNRTFLLLMAGFATCGFHMVIIESHLFNQFVLDGIDGSSAAWAFSAYGISTILGALLSGFLSTRLSKGRLLVFYYGFRALWVAAYLLIIPKTLPFAVLFGIGLGMTGDATVSPTSGLVHREFSTAQAATLIGVLFLCHQIGAFLSAWLGGMVFDATGSYTALWALMVAACAFAATMSAKIRCR